MTEPDELYTLRAQYWLGHYNLCLEEAKSVARRPMSAALKTEREEFMLRALLGLGQVDKVVADASGDDKSPGVQALGLRALYESSGDDDAAKHNVLEKLQTLLADHPDAGMLRVTAAHVFLQAGRTKEALECVSSGTDHLELLALSVQILLRLDRLDLAADQVRRMRATDEDAVLTALCGIFLDTCRGRSTAPDAIHHLLSLQEQYGPSVLLLNALAVAHLTAGNLADAGQALEQAAQDETAHLTADTLINTVVCGQCQGKSMAELEPLLEQLKTRFPQHAFVQGLLRVEGAFAREAVKYKVPTKA